MLNFSTLKRTHGFGAAMVLTLCFLSGGYAEEKGILIEAVALQVLLDTKEDGKAWLEKNPEIFKGAKPKLGIETFALASSSTSSGTNDSSLAVAPWSRLAYRSGPLRVDLDKIIALAAVSTEVRILSTPVVIAPTHHATSVEISEERPVLGGHPKMNGGSLRSSYKYVKRGLTLTFIPQVKPKGIVGLKIVCTEEHVTGSEVVDGHEQPMVSRTVNEVQIDLGDGESAILGVKLAPSKKRLEIKVPLLGSIPVLGSLFRYDKFRKVDSELLIAITPCLVNLSEAQKRLQTPP